jgi:hypothetical protein
MSKIKVLSVIIIVFIAGFAAGWAFEVIDNYYFSHAFLDTEGFDKWLPQFWNLF